MILKIQIRRNRDGSIATYTETDDYFASPTVWDWQSYSCDCCRAELFISVRKELADDIDIACGADRFAVRITNTDTGELIFSDFEERI